MVHNLDSTSHLILDFSIVIKILIDLDILKYVAQHNTCTTYPTLQPQQVQEVA
jgi:hypothetical protein